MLAKLAIIYCFCSYLYLFSTLIIFNPNYFIDCLCVLFFIIYFSEYFYIYFTYIHKNYFSPLFALTQTKVWGK